MEQIERIKIKLKKAKAKDKKLKVFGANRHKYFIGKPVEAEQIHVFEKEYNISLPDGYKTFITQIGNGGISYSDSAAGPFYGIYPFDKRLDELVNDPVKYLPMPVSVYNDMPDEHWEELTKEIESGEELSDEKRNGLTGKIYAAIMPIGSQGCTYLHGLVLNGSHAGKVIYLDLDNRKPFFTFEDNFLDWYERWLDEIISGKLLKNNADWFAITMNDSKI